MKKSFAHKLGDAINLLYMHLKIFKMRMLWLFTYSRKHPVAIYKQVNDIPLALKWGTLYKYDPPRDPVYHPTQIQKHLDQGGRIGDCDDHAIYWCAALLKSKLAKRVWFSTYFFTTSKGIPEGHAICVFEGLDGKMYWGDYSTPTAVEVSSSVLPYKFNWLPTAMQKYDAVRTVSAAMFEIDRINWRDVPVLKKPITIGAHTLEEIINKSK